MSIIAILTSFKSYDDHCNKNFAYSIDPPKTKNLNYDIRKKNFDNHLSYRICSMLRDYAQHRALPLGGFSIGGAADFYHDDAGDLVKGDAGYSVSPWLDVAKFKNSSQCKPNLKSELDRLGYQKIDMKWLVRSFVGAMYERHARLREYLEPKIKTAGEKISSGYSFASAAKGEQARFLELHGNGEKKYMRNGVDKELLSSFESYASLPGAIRSYVTSQIERKADTYAG